MTLKGHLLVLVSLLALGSAAMFYSSTNSKPAVAAPEPTTNSLAANSATRQQTVKAYGNLPLSFEANRGQTDSQAKFIARGGGYTLFLTPHEAVFSLRGFVRQASTNSDWCGESRARMNPKYLTRQSLNCDVQSNAMRIKLVGASQTPEVVGVDELPGKSNYFIGNDPSKWRTNVPTYAKVRYRNLYPGVDLVFYGNQHRLEHDFIVAPGANPASIALGFDRSGKLEIDNQGDLVLSNSGGEVRLYKPLVYQEGEHGKETVQANYVLKGDRQVGFEIAQYDKEKPLVIDPVLGYSTYLGGSSDDYGNGIAVDASKNVYIGGDTTSTAFPGTAPILPAMGKDEAFVAKLNPTGTQALYFTFLGGSDVDEGLAIAVDTGTNAYLTGYTRSSNFPVTASAFQSSIGGGTCETSQNVAYACGDAFVAKLNASGALAYSSYLGGNKDDAGWGIAADSSGKAYVAGTTPSNFPTTAANALQPTQVGLGFYPDAFVSKIDTTQSGIASLVYSTYLGGANGETDGYAIAADSAGHAYITGETFAATSFPITAGAYQPSLSPVGQGNSGYDAFVTKLDTTQAGAHSLVYSTYLGGNNQDTGYGIAVDPSKNIYVVGATISGNFPTKNAFQTAPASTWQCFVSSFNASGGLSYSTYLGGNNGGGNNVDECFGVAVDSTMSAYVTGITQSSNFPLFRPFQTAYGGGAGDAFVTKFNSTGTALYSSFLGGNGSDTGFGIAVDSANSAYVTGTIGSTNFPTTAGVLQTAAQGGLDAFATRIDDIAPDWGLVAVTGTSTSICVENDPECTETVSQGGTATYNLEIVPFNGFTGTVTITCAGTPTLTICNPPASVTSNNYQFSVNVVTTPRSSDLFRFPGSGSTRGQRLIFVVGVLSLCAMLIGLLIVPRARWIFATAMSLTLLGLLTACGGGGGGSGGGGGGTVPGPYSFTISANNGGTTRTITLNLQVNKS